MNQEVDKKEVIRALYAMNNDPYRIATAVREDITYVRRVIASFGTETRFAEPEDTEIADSMRNLAWRALDEALTIFESGHPSEKYGLVKVILGRIAGMVGAQTSTRYEDMRNELEEVLSGQRGTDAPLETPEELDAAEPEFGTFTGDFDDPDEGTYN